MKGFLKASTSHLIIDFCNMTKGKDSLEQRRNHAYDVYMTTAKSHKDIAALVGVSVDSLGRWINEKGWRQEKAARSVTKEKVIGNLLTQIKNLQDNINSRDQKWPTAGEADTITKLSNTIDTLSGKLSLPLYIESLSEFLKFLHEAKPVLSKEVADYVNAFVQSKAKQLA